MRIAQQVGIPTTPPSLKMDVVRGCMFGLLIMGISRIHQLYGWLIVLHLGNVLVALPAALLILAPKLNVSKGWLKRFHTRLIFFLLCSVLGSIAFGISQGGAFYTFRMNVSTVFITAFLMLASIRNVKDLRVVIWGYVLGTGILVYMSIFIFQVKQEGSMERLSGQASWDANDIGLLMVAGLPLVLLCFRTAGKFGKMLTGAIAIGTATVIAITGSRGAFLGMVAMILAFLFTARGVKVSHRVATIVVLATGLILAAPEGYWHQMETIGDSQEDYNTFAIQGRKQLAIRGMQYMMDHPMFGIGVGQFGRAEAFISDRAQHWNSEMAGIKWSAAHNSWVQAGSELGIPGFLLYITMVLSCIVIPFRLRKKVPKSWATGDWEQRFLYQTVTFFPLAGLGFAAASSFVSFAFNDPIYFLVAMCNGTMLSVDLKIKELKASGADAGGPAPVSNTLDYNRMRSRGAPPRFSRGTSRRVS